MFADHVALYGESRKEVEAELERWRHPLERTEIKEGGGETEYLCGNER